MKNCKSCQCNATGVDQQNETTGAEDPTPMHVTQGFTSDLFLSDPMS